MKKIIINKEQSKILSEAIMRESETLSHLPSVVLSDIDNGNYPLSGNKCLPSNCDKFVTKLIVDRFSEIGEEFSDDIFNVDTKTIENKLSRLMSICVKKETRIRKELEQICFNTVSSLLGVTKNDAEYIGELVDTIDSSKLFHITSDTDEDFEYDNVESIDDEDIEVEKRKVLSTIVVGGAMKLSEDARKLYLNDIFEIDSELPHLYNKIIKLNNFLLFRKKLKITDKNHMQSGYVTVDIGSENQVPKISVKATIFPILLMESIKGYLELITSNSLPDDSTVAKKVINRSDVLEDEPWQMLIGPKMWDIVFGECEINDIPMSLNIISKMKTKNLIRLFKELFCRTKFGKNVINRVYELAKEHSDRDKFNGDIEKKQQDNNNDYLITDDRF